MANILDEMKRRPSESLRPPCRSLLARTECYFYMTIHCSHLVVDPGISYSADWGDFVNRGLRIWKKKLSEFHSFGRLLNWWVCFGIVGESVITRCSLPHIARHFICDRNSVIQMVSRHHWTQNSHCLALIKLTGSLASRDAYRIIGISIIIPLTHVLITFVLLSLCTHLSIIHLYKDGWQFLYIPSEELWTLGRPFKSTLFCDHWSVLS